MAKTFTIPSQFTASDKFSSPVAGMSRTLESFISKAEAGAARSERAFRKMTPAISEAQKQLFSLVGTAALVSAAIGGLVFSGRAIMDYETAIANLSSITGTTGAALDKFKTKIADVAKETKESSINVANAFTMVGNNVPALLKDADALAEVTKQSIILSQAAKMELAPSADYLTKIMNQFEEPAKNAKKVIDLLAGGMVIGSTDINKVSDAMLIFGGSAKSANIELNEAVTAIEAVSDKITDMSRLGTQFRNIFTRMNEASTLDAPAKAAMRAAKINTNVLESKTLPLLDKLIELKKLQNVKGGATAFANIENSQGLNALIDAIPKYQGMLAQLNKEVEKGGIAQRMADTNNATLARGIEILKNKFVTWMTTSNEAAKALEIMRGVVGFLADHMVAIIKVTGLVIGAFVGWWTWIKILQARIVILKAISQVFFMVDMIKYIASTQGMTFATSAWTIAQESLNVAMAANPIGIAVTAVAALATGIYLLIDAQNQLDEIYQKGVQAAKTEQIDNQRKAIEKLTELYMGQGATPEAAREKALKNTVKFDDARMAVLEANLNKAQQVLDNINPVLDFLNGSNDSKAAQKNLEEAQSAFEIGSAVKSDAVDLINPKADEAEKLSQTINNNTKKEVNITVKAAPGTEAKVDGSGANDVTPQYSSTMHRQGGTW